MSFLDATTSAINGLLREFDAQKAAQFANPGLKNRAPLFLVVFACFSPVHGLCRWSAACGALGIREKQKMAGIVKAFLLVGHRKKAVEVSSWNIARCPPVVVAAPHRF